MTDATTDHVIAVTIDPRLTHMLKMQRDLQLLYNNGKDIADFTPEERMQALLENAYSLCDEIHEAMSESGWKPWTTSYHVNTQAFHDELVDAWHFFMNLMLHTGMSADDLYRGYLRKNGVNIHRQAIGYDGVSTKCPECKAAYDDLATKCKPGHSDPDVGTSTAWCDKIKRYIRPNNTHLSKGNGA
jgi:dimeric dUTPase (all-alpha-NTP-PPase superfamily)